MKSFFDAGVTVASSSDTIATYLDPLWGLQMAITRVEPVYEHLDPNNSADVLGPEERITLSRLLKVTLLTGPTLFTWRTSPARSLEVGKKADLVVLSGNLFDFRDHPEDIFENIKVDLTIFDGEFVYTR